MLHEKLERASRDAGRRRVRLALAAAVPAVLVALFLLGAIRVDPGVFGLNDDEAAPTVAAPTSEGGIAVREARPPGPQLAPVAPAGEDPALRETFKRALAGFEEAIEPRVAAEAFASWDAAAQRAIMAGKAEAIAAFARGEYADAIARLGEAEARAGREFEAKAAVFDTALGLARSAYDADDPVSASPHIERALALDPDSEAARALAERIGRLPSLLTLIGKAAVARTERDLEGEADFLEQALAIERTRPGLAERLAAVRGEIREARFARAIEAGFAAVVQENPAAAGAALARARSVFADRQEVALLAREIAALTHRLEVARLLGAAESASGTDDWTAAEAFYGRVVAIAPDDRTALDGLARARRIVALDGAIAGHLAAAHRLSSPQVAGEAGALVERARALAGTSPSLAGKAETLAGLAESYARKVPVRVVSDGETSVSVRGVGRVGATTGRTIELRPGRYTFEGARPGYRSTLVEIDVPPGAEGVVVEVRCDERV